MVRREGWLCLFKNDIAHINYYHFFSDFIDGCLLHIHKKK